MHNLVETLSAKPKMPRGMKDMRKHGVAETHIKHNHDGSHSITHHHIKPGVQSTDHSAKGMEELHDHLEELLGGKPSQEEMAEE